VALSLLVGFCYFASSLCITVLLASVLAIVVDPVVTGLERWRVSRFLSSAVLIFVGMVVLGTGTYVGYRQVSVVIDNMPEYAVRVGQAISPLTRKLKKIEDSAGRLNSEVSSKRVPEVKVKTEYPEWTTYVLRGVGPATGAMIIVGVVPFLLFFLLIQKARIKQKLNALLGDKIDVPTLVKNIDGMVRAFVLGNLIIGGLMALGTIAVLSTIGLHGAVPIGMVSGFFNLIPFVGAIFAAAIPLGASVFEYQPLGYLGLILVTVVALHALSANFLIPRFIGRRVSISPVAATVGILFWGWLWGVIGVLLAVPLTAFAKIAADSHPSLKMIATLLAERPRVRRSPSPPRQLSAKPAYPQEKQA
jgi:predicted PurR-regulated permease PerM